MNQETFDDLMRRNSADAMRQANEFERRAATDERREELRQKYAGMNDWATEDWHDMDINHAKNRHMYERMEADGTSAWHLWSEDGKRNKHEAVCTIKTSYANGKETEEVRHVMVCALPEDSEETIEGKAAIRFTWTEKEAVPEAKPELRKVSRSTVCALGNKLSSGMDRKAAFKEAWRLAKIGEVKFVVNGVSFGNRQEALRRLTQYHPKDIHAVLVPEPSNRFDPNAIAVKVLVQGSPAVYTLGYVPKQNAKTVKAFLGRVPQLSIVGNDLFGARLSIAV
jgi:hypothetical protein